MRARCRSSSLACALTAQAAPPIKHEVLADGHPLAVWEQAAAALRAAVLLDPRTHVERGLPNFDLQVPGLQRSVMDGFAAAGYAAYADRSSRLRRDAA